MRERTEVAMSTVGGVLVVAISVCALDALWRMTRTHRRLEQHVAAVERLLAEQVRGGVY